MFKLDREKYLQIFEKEGLSAAITALHRDTERWEFDTFEGPKGFQAEDWQKLPEVRDFSRELWNLSMKDHPAAHFKKAE